MTDHLDIRSLIVGLQADLVGPLFSRGCLLVPRTMPNHAVTIHNHHLMRSVIRDLVLELADSQPGSIFSLDCHIKPGVGSSYLVVEFGPLSEEFADRFDDDALLHPGLISLEAELSMCSSEAGVPVLELRVPAAYWKAAPYEPSGEPAEEIVAADDSSINAEVLRRLREA